MHEAIIPRGEVDYAPFEKRLQVFTLQNCLLICPGRCHQLAQHYERGKRICARHLIRWNGEKAILDWLRYLQDLGLTAADEAERRLIEWKFLPLS